MKYLKLKSLFTALLCLFCTSSWAYDCEVNGIYYNRTSVTDFEVTSGDKKYTGDIVIPENVTYNGRTFKVTTIGNYAFYGCTGLTSVIIPDNVATIESGAFYGCTALSIISIPNNVKSIEDAAFRGCTGLTTVSIGNNVTWIGNYAFCDCTALTAITIGPSVTSIGDYVFAACNSLAVLNCLPTIPPTISGSSSFDSPHYTWTDVYVPMGCRSKYQNEAYWKKFISTSEFDMATMSALSATAEKAKDIVKAENATKEQTVKNAKASETTTKAKKQSSRSRSRRRR